MIKDILLRLLSLKKILLGRMFLQLIPMRVLVIKDLQTYFYRNISSIPKTFLGMLF